MFVSRKQPICKHSRPLIAAVDPTGANENLFLTEWNGVPLTEEVDIFGGGEFTITTAPILVDVKFDLMANSNANLLINRGLLDVADTIVPDTVKVQRIYLEILGELFAIDVSREKRAAGIPDLIGDSRGVKIDAYGQVNVDRDTKTVFGETPLWRSMLLEQQAPIFALEWDLKANLMTSRGELRSTTGTVSITMGGPPKETRDPFQVLLQRNTRVVAFTLNTYIG